MGEEVGIVMKLYDQVSPTLKAITGNNKAFDKSMDELAESLKGYEKAQTTLTGKSAELKKALAETDVKVRDAQQSYRKLKDEASKGALDGAIDEQIRLRQELKDTEVAIKANQTAYKALYTTAADEARKLSNGSGGGESGLAAGLRRAGLGKVLGDALSQAADVGLSSAMGEPIARLASSALSGIASGAAMGSMAGSILGLPGAAVGAVAGGAAGLISGGTQIFQKRDEAFKSYVQEAVEGVVTERESNISSGSGIAAGREKDLISFTTLFGNRNTAQSYLRDLVGMANTTPFLYDDLTAMSRTLATYGYGANGILPVLQTIGDAGAALGMGTSDMTMVATALGRMKSSNKTTLEYLNILNDRGIGAVGMLADAYGVDQGTIYEQISKGKIAGGDAVDIILQALAEKFSGSMLEQSKTFSGLTSTLEGMEQEQQNAYGEGYNEARKQGLSDQIRFLSGESGEQIEAANKAIGAWYASLENEKERFLRQAQKEVLESDAYKEAMAAGTDEGYAEAGRLLMEAKVKAQNEYNATDGAKLLRESELTMIEQIRNDTSLSSEYWSAGYEKGQEYSKGLAAGAASRVMSAAGDPAGILTTDSDGRRWTADGYFDDGGFHPVGVGGSYAYGLDRVPYDNYPTLLHQGERVLTAREAREADRGGGGVSVQIGQVSFGADVSDPDAAAETFARALERELMMAN